MEPVSQKTKSKRIRDKLYNLFNFGNFVLQNITKNGLLCDPVHITLNKGIELILQG